MKVIFFVLFTLLTWADTIVVTHYGNNIAHVVNLVDTETSSLLTTIPLTQGYGQIGLTFTRGPSGHAIAYIPVRNDGAPHGYPGSHNVTVIDVQTEQITAVIVENLANFPNAICAMPNGTKVYVACWNDTSSPAPPGTVCVIDTSTNQVKNSIIMQGTNFSGTVPQSMAITPDGQKVFVVCEDTSNVIIIDTATDSIIAAIDIGANPVNSTLSPNGNTLFVGDDSGSVTAIDTQTLSQTSYSPLSVPYYDGEGLGVSDDEHYLYVPNNNDTVTVFDLTASPITSTSQPATSGALGFFMSTIDGYVCCTALPNGQLAQAYVDVYLNGIYQQTLGPPGIGIGTTFGCTSLDGTTVYVGNYYTPSLSVVTFNPISAVQIVPDVLELAVNILLPAPNPSQIIGTKRKNLFLSQAEIYNEITWTIPDQVSPTSFSIYRDSALTDLITTLHSNVLQYKDRARKKNTNYSYYITYTDSLGNVNALGNVTVTD